MDEKTRLKIEYIDINALTPSETNARKHSEKDIQTIAASIREFGFDDPIGVWGEDNMVVVGHGRALAASLLGMTEVPVIRLDHLTEEERRAYAIAHNKTAEQSSWDNEILGAELKDLIGEIDMTAFGFGEFELAMLTEDFEPEPYDNDVIKKYEDNGEKFLAKKRVIITFKEEQTEKLLEFLGLEKLDKVVYDLSEIIE